MLQSLKKALTDSAETEYILFKTQYLNGYVWNNWVTLDQARDMDKTYFKPENTEGGTPLYDGTISLLGGVIFERARALNRGSSNVRWGILVVSDGADTSSKSKAKDVKTILDNLRENKELLVNTEPNNRTAGSIALMGIDDGETPWEGVAKDMGIGWLIRADRKDPTAMRRAFNLFSRKQILG
jgi:hypothetical protein